MDETFSEECYMKIEIGKMWRDYSEFLQSRYVDKYKKEKLKESGYGHYEISNFSKTLESVL